MSKSTDNNVVTVNKTFQYSQMPKLEKINFSQAQFVVPNMKTYENSGNQSDVMTLSYAFSYTDLSSLETIDLRNAIIGSEEKFVENGNGGIVYSLN
jgi:hypothetical protein